MELRLLGRRLVKVDFADGSNSSFTHLILHDEADRSEASGQSGSLFGTFLRQESARQMSDVNLFSVVIA